MPRLPWPLRRGPRNWEEAKREMRAEGIMPVGGDPPPPPGWELSVGGGPMPRSPRVDPDLLAQRLGRRMLEEETMAEVARRIREVAPFDTRLVIFGSHAWGQAGARRDLDLLVIEPNAPEDPAGEAVRLRRALRGLLLAVDIVVVGAAAARQWREVKSSLIGAALAEGRELT